jgi:uncharacterized protein YfaT (DUF1175 family)
MKGRHKPIRAVLCATALVSGLFIARVWPNNRESSDFPVDTREIVLPADGVSTETVRMGAAGVSVRIVEGGRRMRIAATRTEAGDSLVTVRAGVLPGDAAIEARADGFKTQRIPVRLLPDDADSFGDGTPDYLRLDGPDAQAFREWFALLAETAYAMPAERRPAEIADCAALLRFAYREALREHDGAWASGFNFEELPGGASVEKYHYPFTPLGAGLFRVHDGTFAQFADAQTLRRYNTHFIGRDPGAARQGDLLFYRQDAARMPDHAMIYLEKSPLQSGGPWAVYHTGPSDADPGEMRRPTIADLLNHPEPRWRPTAANEYFLGVFRWNILR